MLTGPVWARASLHTVLERFSYQRPHSPGTCLTGELEASHEKHGGADRDRTDDLRLAKPALSQLSYSPLQKLVGLGRFELPTSRLSGVRSNQLSYRPDLPRSAARTRTPSAGRLAPGGVGAPRSVSQNRIVRRQWKRTPTGRVPPD